MRWGMLLVAMAALTACIPRAERGREPRPPTRPLADRGSGDLLQCHIDLARERIRFRRLPDQRFPGGCSALGSVQLADMGTPATGLRAMTCPLAKTFAASLVNRPVTSSDSYTWPNIFTSRPSLPSSSLDHRR